MYNSEDECPDCNYYYYRHHHHQYYGVCITCLFFHRSFQYSPVSWSSAE